MFRFLYALLGAAWVFGNALLIRKDAVLLVDSEEVLLLGRFS
jgi:hypothetical protein